MGKYYVDKYCEKCGCQLHCFNIGGQLFCENCQAPATPVTKEEINLDNLSKRIATLEERINTLESIIITSKDNSSR